ncbi:hypothetical protein HUW62_48020, partial [Myxococcus sp. AM011]|nr:hypothetical protein [Myxococcus sp. AM011]
SRSVARQNPARCWTPRDLQHPFPATSALVATAISINHFAQQHLGAPVRLRMWGAEEGASLVRKEDWDELSDWGQVVQALTIGG